MAFDLERNGDGITLSDDRRPRVSVAPDKPPYGVARLAVVSPDGTTGIVDLDLEDVDAIILAMARIATNYEEPHEC